jgi:hypothetical protein
MEPEAQMMRLTYLCLQLAMADVAQFYDLEDWDAFQADGASIGLSTTDVN